MSSKRLSPTAKLLRSSRLFSLPPPLARPTNDFLGHVQSNQVSETATLPYPTSQAIMTTPSGLARGDWGMKRSLPLKSTKNTSTPVFRVNAVDTREHITDYESASDLTLTLRRIHELNLPVTDQEQRGKRGGKGRVSAFEPDADHTDPEATQEKPENSRWKFKGPWVAGMTQGDFDAYVEKELKRRKPEFTAFLREHRLQQLKTQKQAAARAEGEDISEATADISISDQELADYVKELRQDYNLASELATLITRFLDLPSLPTTSGSKFMDLYSANSTAPLSTHPSAGLTYLLSDAYLDNHPLYGPQARHAPVEARVLASPRSGISALAMGKVGVAGIVANPPSQDSRQRAVPESKELDELLEGPEARTADTDRKGVTIGLGTPGGNRIWVEPTAMSVDSRGRVQLKTSNSRIVEIGVKTGMVGTDVMSRVTRVPQFPSPLTPRMPSTNNAMEGRLDAAPLKLNTDSAEQQQQQKPSDVLLQALEGGSQRNRGSLRRR